MKVDLESAVTKFEAWRSGRANPKQRIPSELWELACQLTVKHGFYQVAKQLRLNQGELKRRSGQVAARQASLSRSNSKAIKVTPLIIHQEKPDCHDMEAPRPVVAEFVSSCGLRVRLFSGVSSDIVKVLLSQALEAK